MARDGITGHLDEYHPVFGEGWKGTPIKWTGAKPDGTGWPIEQSAYWLDGALRLGYLLHDEAIVKKIRARLDPLVDGVNRGEFGTTFLHWKEPGYKPQGFDSWAHSQIGRAMLALYQASGEQRVLDALVKVYADYPADMGEIHFGDVTGLCNLEAMMETYSYSGDERILERALKGIRNAAVDRKINAWCEGNVESGHMVITYENIRLPVVMYPWTGEGRYLQATKNAFSWLDDNHMLPYGVASGEEWAAGIGALRKTETCDIPAMLLAVSWMYRIEGDGTWGNQMERAFFNAGPAPIARDFKTACYYQSPNRIRDGELPIESLAPGKGCLQFTPLAYPRTLCCGGAVNRILPYFIANMWMATDDHGLAATLYGPCAVSALVGEDVEVKVSTATEYPFGEKIRMTVVPREPVHFPLYVRIPNWCAAPEVRVNDAAVAIQPSINRPGFVRIARKWAAGDVVTLSLPMEAKVTTGHETGYPPSIREYFEHFESLPKSMFENRSLPYASVSFGPLLFALPIPDKDPNTPEPGAKWQYALDIAPSRAAEIGIERKPMPARWNWPLDAPIVLKVPARPFDWTPSHEHALPAGPVTGNGSETIDLVPYGCTKFRISMFPLTAKVLEASGEKEVR
ncbi:MAG: glycoside hydrolase family 127 protein [Pirellulales bacterium]|nr:glycoside hydrolase family 127 protein [Pirellulales bacterium]